MAASDSRVARAKLRVATRASVLLLLIPACQRSLPPAEPDAHVTEPPLLGPMPEVENVVVVAADTLRYDRMSAYGAARATTPLLDARMDHAVRADRVFATSNWTLPNTASMLTGALPETAGVDGPVNADAAETYPLLAPSLVPVFHAAGLRTGLFSGNEGLARVLGLEEGFDRVAYVPDVTTGNSREVVDRALAFVDEDPSGSPFFVWLQPMDVHFPYLPPDEVAGTFRDPATLPFPPDAEAEAQAIVGYGELGAAAQEEVRTAMTDLYDEELLYLDRQVERLLLELDARGELDATLVVWTSDHGELFDEAGTGLFLHGASLRPGANRLPLIFYNPHLEPAERELLVSGADLLPTILDALGLDVGSAPDGTAADAGTGRRRAYSWDAVGRHWGDALPPEAALTDGRWKVRVECESGVEEAYDLDADPAELAPFDPDAGETATALRDELRARVASLHPDCL